MKLWSNSFPDGGTIPGDNAFCVPDPATHVRTSGNKNPHLAWDEVPAGVESFVLLCHDPDVPSKGDDVNQEGRTVPPDLPRVDFMHWTLADIPPTVRGIGEGEFSDGITARGKPGPVARQRFKNCGVHELRQGINDYTGWFASDPEMAGQWFGYDGPCPPWNDSLMHHYIFRLYALDIPRLPLEGSFTGQQVREAIKGHILAEAQIVGEYTLNPALARAG